MTRRQSVDGPALSRRSILRTGAALGVAGSLSTVADETVAQSPDLARYVQPLPVPGVRDPDGRRDGMDYYEIPLREFDHTFHPDLGPTTVWGFDGSVPGPILEAERGEPSVYVFDNSDLPTDHLLEVDTRIHGTTPGNYPHYDGEVPEVRTVTHFHGLKLAEENDGQANMWTSPDGVEGPDFADAEQVVPHEQHRLTSTYHDHALGISRLNNYAGLNGLYYVESEAERQLGLPDGEYDVPLFIQDKAFEADGSLHYPDEFVGRFTGDTAVVNGAAWPYLEVEPRRYRFRIVNGSNQRTLSLGLRNETGTGAPALHQFSPGHSFLEEVVEFGEGGDLDLLTLGAFERAEVVVDFSDFAGETFVLTNAAEHPYLGNGSGSDLGELLQFRVTDPSTPPSDPSTHPTDLDLPEPRGYDEDRAWETREMSLDVTSEEHFRTFLLNGYGFGEEEGFVYPTLNTTEVWEFENNTGGTHPMHMHLVTFEVVGRGPDGTEPPEPHERGEKDTVRVHPGETVRIATTFEDYTGGFPWHCHMLEHEDNRMMLPFVIEALPMPYGLDLGGDPEFAHSETPAEVDGVEYRPAPDPSDIRGVRVTAAGSDEQLPVDLPEEVSADGPSRYASNRPVRNTDHSALYQTGFSGTDLALEVGLEDGRYDLDLHFCEVRWPVAGQRVFDLAVQGETVLEDFDVAAEAGAVAGIGGDHVAVRETVEDVLVDDGTLSITTESTSGQSILSGFAITERER